MRCLGLDLGSKTLGIAISDRTNFIASVYTTIFFKDENYQSLIEPLREIILKEDVGTLVLGLPKNMNNSLGTRAMITLEFKEMLEKELKLPVIMEDERLTSVISNNILINANMSRNKRKKKVDGMKLVIMKEKG
jgi:putative Holliday junction resolvase